MNSPALYRSNQHHMIAGVMGGIAERYGWNVTILRVLFVLISCISAAFPGILVYLVLWMVLPKAPVHPVSHHSNQQPPRW